MCLSPFHLKYQTFDGSWRESDVPCGHCEECIRRAQNDLMVLVFRQLDASRGENWFVTLTYKDECLPLALTFTVYEDLRVHDSAALVDPLETFDIKKHGLLIKRSKPVRLSRTPLKTFNSYYDSIASDPEDWKPTRSSLVNRENAVRAEYARRFRWNGFNGRSRNCVKPGCVMELSRRWFNATHDKDGAPYIVIASVTTSVDRKDPQLWLKNCRVAYERKFGCKLPADMSYTMVQEYGPRGKRPHYHIVFTNIREADLVWCLGRWSREYTGDPNPHIDYGTGVVYSFIKRVTENKGNGYASAGKYLGSYLKKFDFIEDPLCKAGLCVKPRRCSSKFFGMGKDFNSLCRDVLGFDVLGEYDLNDPENISPDVVNLVRRRSHLSLPLDDKKCVNLPLPQYLRNKILKNVKVKKSYRKVRDRFTPLGFNSFCESSGFMCEPYHYEEVLVKYPCSSALSQGVADFEALRADELYQEELHAFAGVPYIPGDLPADIPLAVVDAFERCRAAARAEKAFNLRSAGKSFYQKSKSGL